MLLINITVNKDKHKITSVAKRSDFFCKMRDMPFRGIDFSSARSPIKIGKSRENE